MTTTARISATTDYSTYDVTVPDGVTLSFAAYGLKREERIIFKAKDASGNYHPITYRDNGGVNRTREILAGKNQEKIPGPVDLRIEKPATTESVGLVEYT